ncbi:hypothetical protein FA15DRAFT_707811 [Coprinopsis marcescibilis]|uniref:TPR-like protein n=1 Tax=Coprinopsis marcescibilis TaxID=230819 RepID=A0A5C3KKK1_COPMA|nr:hypothetical protein FA15DRAFT_707811 [Coprinopsis marcescibilis]
MAAALYLDSRYEEALPLLREAGIVYRQAIFIKSRPNSNPSVELDLAWSMQLYSSCLGLTLSFSDAQDNCAQAIDVVRELQSNTTVDTRACLAKLLEGRGRLVQVDSEMEGLRAHSECVEIYRQLAASDPERFEVSLVSSLRNLSCDMASCGDHSQAREMALEAIVISRQLSAGSEVNVAQSLTNLARCLIHSECSFDSIEPLQQAINIYRTLSVSDNPAYQIELESCLSALLFVLDRHARYDEAISLAKESVDMYRQAVRERTSPHDDQFLADWICKHAQYLSVAGRNEEAIEHGAEAIAMYRILLEADRDKPRYSLVISLKNQAQYLSECGRYADAAENAKEAISYLRLLLLGWDRISMDIFDRKLAECLNNYAWYLTHVPGRADYEEAIEAGKEAVSTQRALVEPWEDDEAASLSQELEVDLANYLHTLAHALNLAERYDDAVSLAKESVSICCRLKLDLCVGDKYVAPLIDSLKACRDSLIGSQ